MMNGFLHQTPSLPEMAFDQGGPVSRGQVHVDPSQGIHLRAKSTSPVWDGPSGMEAGYKNPMASPFSADEFASFQHASQNQTARSSPMPNSAMSTHSYRPMMGVGMMNTGYNMGMQTPMYNHMYHQPQQHMADHQTDVKGKGKIVELDDHQWEEQFAQIELQDKQAREDENLAMEPELNKMDEKILESETGFGDFESIWRGIQNENAAMRSMADDDLGIKWGDDMEGWGAGSGRITANPPVEEYLFEEENLFKDQQNPFEEGVRIMNEGGNLSLAALAFEAAVQKQPDHVEAWVYLGSAQAQNEKEEAAIRALEHE